MTNTGELAAVEQELKAGGWEYTVDNSSRVKWVITATRGGGDPNNPTAPPESTVPISDQWELAANLLEKDLLESDSPMIQDLYLEDSVSFDDDMKNLRKYMNDADAIPARADYDPLYPVYYSLVDIIRSGVKSIRLFQPTLRHVQLITSKYELKDSLAKCGKIITAADIESSEGVPDTIHFNLPDEIGRAHV